MASNAKRLIVHPRANCAFCGDEFEYEARRGVQRFCSARCARDARTGQTIDVEVVDPMQPMAEACIEFIVGRHHFSGVRPIDLAMSVPGYADLSACDQFRVHVLICKDSQRIYFDADEDTFRFWPKERQQQGEIIARAARFA